MVWYYMAGDKQVGPVTEEEFGTLIEADKLTADTPVWREGLANWVRLADSGLVEADQEPAQPAAPPADGRTFFRKVGDCFRAGKRRISLSNEMRKINAGIEGLRQELDLVWIAIGTKDQVQSSDAGSAGLTMPAAVIESRAAVTSAQAACDDAQQALARAGEDSERCKGQLAALQRDNAVEMDRLGKDYEKAAAETARLEAAAKAAAGSVSALDLKIQALQAEIANAAAGKPDSRPAGVLMDEKAGRDRQRAGLVEAQLKVASEAVAAKTASETKRAAFGKAKTEAQNRESQAKAAAKSAAGVCEDRARAVRAAQGKMQMARKALGRALHAGGIAVTGCETYFVQADAAMKALADLDAKSADTRRQIDAVGPEVRRLAVGLSMILAVAVALCMINMLITVYKVKTERDFFKRETGQNHSATSGKSKYKMVGPDDDLTLFNMQIVCVEGVVKDKIVRYSDNPNIDTVCGIQFKTKRGSLSAPVSCCVKIDTAGMYRETIDLNGKRIRLTDRVLLTSDLKGKRIRVTGEVLIMRTGYGGIGIAEVRANAADDIEIVGDE